MQTRKWKLQLNEQIQCNYFQTPPVAHLAKGTTIKLFPYIYHLKLGLLNPRGKTWAGQMETRSWSHPGASDFPLTWSLLENWFPGTVFEIWWKVWILIKFQFSYLERYAGLSLRTSSKGQALCICRCVGGLSAGHLDSLAMFNTHFLVSIQVWLMPCHIHLCASKVLYIKLETSRKLIKWLPDNILSNTNNSFHWHFCIIRRVGCDLYKRWHDCGVTTAYLPRRWLQRNPFLCKS